MINSVPHPLDHPMVTVIEDDEVVALRGEVETMTKEQDDGKQQ